MHDFIYQIELWLQNARDEMLKFDIDKGKKCKIAHDLYILILSFSSLNISCHFCSKNYIFHLIFVILTLEFVFFFVIFIFEVVFFLSFLPLKLYCLLSNWYFW